MPNSKSKRTISMNVPVSYPFGGAEVKRELDAFFQYIWDEHREAFLNYPKQGKIKEVLGKW